MPRPGNEQPVDGAVLRVVIERVLAGEPVPFASPPERRVQHQVARSVIAAISAVVTPSIAVASVTRSPEPVTT